jgi:hypothetical protein
MVAYPDTRVLPVAEQLMRCLCDAVLLNPDPPAICGFRTGTTGQPLAGLSVDECCGGAAFIRILRTFPSWATPNESPLSFSCAQPSAAEFELSMWRCTSLGTMNVPPTQAQWDALNTKLLNDRLSMMDAICCFMRQRDKRSVKFNDWTPVDVEGGCVGSTIVVSADLFGTGIA